MKNLTIKDIRLAVINNDIKKIQESWKSLSENKIIEILKISYLQRNMEMLEMLSLQTIKDVHNQIDEEICQLIEKAIDKEDIDLSIILYHIRHSFIYSTPKLSREDNFLRWATINNYFRIIPKLDWNKCTQMTKLKLLIQIALDYNINSENKITLVNDNIEKDIQPILDKLNEENINIFNSIEEVLTELIEPEKLDYSLKVKNIHQYIEKYIESEVFLKTIITNNSKEYPLNINDLKQDIFNLVLQKAMKVNMYGVIEYIVNKGAQLNTCKEEDLVGLLSFGQLSFVTTLIESGFNIEKHKKELLERHLIWGRIDVVKYLIDFFDNKKELSIYIEQIKQVKGTAIQFKKILSNSKKEIRKYMERLILEEKLQKELMINSYYARNKL